jgi:hypothetical protein
MTEEARLDEALGRADQMMLARLRREEANRRKKILAWMWAAVALAFILGLTLGALATMLTQKPQPAPAKPQPQAQFLPEETPTTGPCEVKSGYSWKRATIVNTDDEFFLVKYDGWNDFFNEWVTKDRIRPIGSIRDTGAYAPPTPHGKKPTSQAQKGNTTAPQNAI